MDPVCKVTADVGFQNPLQQGEKGSLNRLKKSVRKRPGPGMAAVGSAPITSVVGTPPSVPVFVEVFALKT
jgi:hypothetical protein